MTEEHKINRNKIYLAALLHDIGKFYQRADEVSVTKSKYLSVEIKNLEDLFCPENSKIKGKLTHKHVLWTAQFFKDFESHLKGFLIKEKNTTIDSLMRLAAIHHKPSGNEINELIIQKADHYSSGADRSKINEAWKDAQEEETWDSFKNVRMRSVFEGVSLKNIENKVWSTDYKNRLALCEMQLNNNFFEHLKNEEFPDYVGLWKKFEQEVKFVQTSSFKTFSETLLYLLEKYTSRIPSSTQHLPDVSLYDHLKTTAAFAVCLYDFVTVNNRKLPKSDDKPFLLIGGDLSGIQKFIYSIIARGAAKNLKGRSFYLQLLINNVVNLLVKELDLFDANIIYKSGGGFYLLAPNTMEVKEKIKSFENTICEKLFEFHKIDLFLAIDYTEFGEEELFFEAAKNQRKTIGNIWSELTEKLSIKKSRRFLNIITKNYDLFFKPDKTGGASKRDEITGEEILEKGVNYDGHFLNEYTKKQIELGEKLRDVDYWVFSEEKLSYFPKDAFEFEVIGTKRYNYFVPKKFFDNEDNRNQLKKSADKVRAIAINDLNFLETPQKGIDNIYGFSFYGGNKYPESKWHRSPKTFEEIAGVEFSDDKKNKREKAPNLVRMGVLRMDVDNLGAIFRRGLSPDKRSFSRYSVLSRSLDYFFSGYINEIWRNNEVYHQLTQIIYSGGDDLFIVGKWDVLIEMAKEINAKFREWTCNNSDLTLSSGIAFVYPKFPILKAAEMSASEEKNAKNHICQDIEKNAISFFGFAFNFDYEYKYLVKLKDEIKYLLNSGLAQGFPSDMFNLMQQAGLVYKEDHKKYVITNYQVVWMAAYSFKRAVQNNKNESVNDFLETWIDKIFTGSINEIKETKYHALQYLAIAARWASMELR
ncbi:MAG TPA: type III-A CRISPR-associated protein Cas10/Csm1 [Bacteroidales bacterium]|nr:type III-A CRISPR-associated protein Cas10/Csm1 [Bacteroidales bacterium]